MNCRQNSRITGLRWLLGGLIAVSLILSQAHPAYAHPLGNFTVNRYSRLELSQGQVLIYYVVDMAEIPTFQEKARIDADHDGALSSDEQAHYLASQVAVLQGNLHLSSNGTLLKLERVDQALEFPPGQGGL